MNLSSFAKIIALYLNMIPIDSTWFHSGLLTRWKSVFCFIISFGLVFWRGNILRLMVPRGSKYKLERRLYWWRWWQSSLKLINNTQKRFCDAFIAALNSIVLQRKIYFCGGQKKHFYNEIHEKQKFPNSLTFNYWT